MDIKEKWNERYSAAQGELHAAQVLRENLQLFSGLQAVFYREEGRFGDVHKGCRDEAMYIGRKTGIC